MKKFIAIMAAILSLCASAFAEFDDDILVRTGDFSMHIGWGLAYKPGSIDGNETIFPLLTCVQKNYRELKSIERDFYAALFRSKTNPQGVELVVREGGSSKQYNCDDEEDCVNVLVNLVADLVPDKKPAKSREELTLYVVMKKQEYENENDWTHDGEFERHTLTYNLTKDKCFYAMYFSLEEAERQAKKNPLSKIKKVVCTKETVKRLDIGWDTVLENALESADEKLSEIYASFTGEKMLSQIAEKLNADFTGDESKAIADYVRLENIALEDAVSLGNGIYFLAYEVRVDFSDEKKRSNLQDSLSGFPTRHFVILTYDSAQKMILNLGTRANNYAPPKFFRKDLEKTTVLYCTENFSRAGSGLADKRLSVMDAFTFEPLATEVILYSDETLGIGFEKDYDFYSDRLSVGGEDFDFESGTKFTCEREYHFGLHHTFVLERRSDGIENDGGNRWRATLIRGDGSWELGLPPADVEAKNLGPPQFEETDEGFSISFGWGGGRWFNRDTLLFRDDEDGPVLHKVRSQTDEYGRTKDGDFDIVERYEETREINPPIKISRLGENAADFPLKELHWKR